jgi:hypothetical protein
VTGFVREAIRGDTTRRALGQALDRFLTEAGRRTWKDLLGALPGDRVAQLIGEALARDSGRRWMAESGQALMLSLLDRPLGRPATWLGEDAVETLTRSASDAAWRWVHEQVPLVLGHLHIQEMVEQKVLGFSTQRMEEIVRTVTQRELDLIVNLGYWLGGMVGLVAYGVNLLLR